LLEGPELRPIREKMHASGYDCVLQPSGAKIFVYPEQLEEVKAGAFMSRITLRASHVIIVESLIPALEASIVEISSKQNVRVKRDGILEVATVSMPHAADEPTTSAEMESKAWEHVYETKPLVILILRNPQSVNQSTKEVHGGLNPRRYTVDQASG